MKRKGRPGNKVIQTASNKRVFFEDEAPRIGSGWRSVHIKVGHKWVFFTDTVTKARVRKPIKEATAIILGSIERSSR